MMAIGKKTEMPILSGGVQILNSLWRLRDRPGEGYVASEKRASAPADGPASGRACRLGSAETPPSRAVHRRDSFREQHLSEAIEDGLTSGPPAPWVRLSACHSYRDGLQRSFSTCWGMGTSFQRLLEPGNY